MGAFHFFENVRGFGGPGEQLGVLIVARDIALDDGDELSNIVECSPAHTLYAQVAEEAFDHVQPRSAGRHEVHLHAWMAPQPALYFGVLMGRIVVGDHVQGQLRRRFGLQQFQKAQPLAMRVARLAHAEHLTVQDIQSGEQRGRSVPLIVVRHGLRSAQLQRKAGLRAIQRLNLTLLVGRKHHRMIWLVQVQAHDLLQLFRKRGIVADLESFDAMRLQPMRAPDPPPRRGADTHGRRYGAGAPMRGVARFFLGGQAHDALYRLRSNRGRSPSARTVFFNSGQAVPGVTFAPAAHFETTHRQPTGDLIVAPAFRRQQHDLRALAYAQRQTATARQRFQLRALLAGKFDFLCDSHVWHLLRYQTASHRYVALFMAHHTRFSSGSFPLSGVEQRI